MSFRKMIILVIAGFLIPGCCTQSSPAPEAKPAVPAAPMSQADQMRKKANIAEAASLVGYNGKAIKRDLNKLIDQQEKSAKQLEDLKDF